MREGFLVASADTLPFAWAPTRRFPSADLARAWQQLERCCSGAEKPDAEKQDAEKQDPFAKTMILATIGLWTKQKRMSWFA